MEKELPVLVITVLETKVVHKFLSNGTAGSMDQASHHNLMLKTPNGFSSEK